MTIVELVQFKLQPGVSDADFIAAADQAQTGFLQHFAGFIKRELWKQDDETWVDLVYWATSEAAQESMKQFLTHPGTQRFMSMILPDSATASHYVQVKAFEGESV